MLVSEMILLTESKFKIPILWIFIANINYKFGVLIVTFLHNNQFIVNEKVVNSTKFLFLIYFIHHN